MRALVAMALIIAAPAAAHQQRTPSTSSDVTVRAPGRLICRPTSRTGTRVGSAARCRTRAEWETEGPRSGEYRTIEEASAKLGVIGDSCTPGPQGCE